MKSKKRIVDNEIIEQPNAYIPKERCIFYGVMKRISVTKGVFDTLKDALKSMVIKFIRPTDPDDIDSGGWSINAFDKRTRALIKQKIYVSTFDDFYLSPEYNNEYSIGVNTKTFATYIKQAGVTDILTWYVDKDNTDELVFVFYNPIKNITNVRKLKLYNIKEDAIHIPNTDFVCQLGIRAEDFHKYIKDSSICTEDIAISFIDTETTQNTIILSDPKGMAECILTEESEGITIEKTNPKGSNVIIKNVYKLKNLIIFGKSQTYCSHVQLFLKDNYPLIVNYDIENYGYTVLILPPISDGTDKPNDDEDDDEDDDDDDDERNKLHREEGNSDEEEKRRKKKMERKMKL